MVLEALERMLLQKYAMLSNDSEQFIGLPQYSMEKLRVFSEVRSQENLDYLMSDEAIEEMMRVMKSSKKKFVVENMTKQPSFGCHIWTMCGLCFPS